MSVLWPLLVLVAIGIAETTYLIRTRKAAERPVCIIGNDCHIVLASKYNRLFFIHNDVAGLLFYLTAGMLTALLIAGVGDSRMLVNLFVFMLAVASLFSFGLIYIQWRLIKAWCFWCLMSASTVWLMAGILATQFIWV